MRVLYVSKASIVASHRDKVRALGERVEVELVVPRRWNGADFEPAGFDRGLRIHRRRAWLHGHNHLHVYPGLGGLLDTGDFDLVHVDEEPYSAVTWSVTGAAGRRGIPSLFFAWQNLDKGLPLPFEWLRSGVFDRVRGGIAGTRAAGRVLRRAGFEGELAVVPQMGVDEDRFRPDPAGGAEERRALGLAPGDFVVGFVGRLVPEKGPDLLVEALARLPSARLVLVGGGPEARPLSDLARRSGVDDRVVVTGPVESLRVPRLMTAFDALVLPSRTTPGWSEQFGRVLVEAMACGVAVVGSDSGAIPEVVGEAGRIVPEDDTEALVDTLAELRERSGLRDELAERGRARVLRRFTQDRVADETVGFYERLLGREGRASRRATSHPGRRAVR